MAAVQSRPPVPENNTSKKPVTVPFVFDGFKPHAKPRVWKAGAKAKAFPNRVSAELGTVTVRIAGSAVTLAPRALQLRIDSPESEPMSYLDVPMDQKPFGVAGVLFVSDDTTSADDLARFWASVRDQAIKQYAEAKIDGEKINFATVDHKALAAMVGTSAGAGKIR
jgi:hypothetical protein